MILVFPYRASSFISADISKYVDDLSQILSHLKSVKPESGYALLINGAQNFEYANWKDAKVQLSQGEIHERCMCVCV